MSTNKQKIQGFFSIAILAFVLFLGWNNQRRDTASKNSSQASSTIELIVSAAASLKHVMEEIEPLYEQQYPHIDIIYNFASSGSLQRQIEQGAPVDVFISAANKQMDALEQQGLLLTKSRRDLLQNQIVLVVPRDHLKNNLQENFHIDNFPDLTNQKVQTIALGEPESVPAGKYAQEVLNSFQITETVNSKAVYGKDVRQVLNYVATGNVDAGIVYRTDAQLSAQVEIVAIAPKTSHSPVIYPIAVIKDSHVQEAATELIDFLNTPSAQAVFEDYGFVSVSNK